MMVFVIVMEGLSTLLEYAEYEGKVKGLEKKESGVNHILFANDVMLFSKANPQSIKHVEEVLDYFAKVSGFQPNIHKSKIIFSKGVTNSVKQKSSFKKGFLLIRYLGVPLHSKKLNECHYQPSVDKKKAFIHSILFRKPEEWN